MIIALARVDDRLIHGQVTTVWSRHANISRIIVVCREAANDKLRSTLLKQVAPPGISVHVVDPDKFVRVYNNPKYKNDRVMILFDNIHEVKETIEKGVEIEVLNLGSISYKKGRIQLGKAIFFTKEESEILLDLANLGVKFDTRGVTTDSQIDIVQLIKDADFK